MLYQIIELKESQWIWKDLDQVGGKRVMRRRTRQRQCQIQSQLVSTRLYCVFYELYDELICFEDLIFDEKINWIENNKIDWKIKCSHSCEMIGWCIAYIACK